VSVQAVEQSQLLAETLSQALRQAFDRSDTIFDLIVPQAYYERPIALRHPINFYEGHLAAFIWNTLFRRVLKKESFNPAFDRLFERGIDPGTREAADEATILEWPDRQAVREYKRQIHEQLFNYLNRADYLSPQHPLLKNGELIFLLLEHELMHQETLLYMVHQLPHELKVKPVDYSLPLAGTGLKSTMVDIPAGKTVLGAKPGEFPFCWDNELPGFEVEIDAFSMDVFNVTNAQFVEFIEASGYQREEFWTPQAWRWLQEQQKSHPQNWIRSESGWRFHSFFEEMPLPLFWPVYVTQAEAAAYARFVGKDLPTEAEWHRAAYGDNQTAPYPWGIELSNASSQGNFNFQKWTPVPVGSYSCAPSPYGVHDLSGNGWEWTCTPFEPFPGFQPSAGYPQYSADFFDGQHYVIKGASCFTDARLLRRSFRNWYYWHYPYMYATFRCVKRG
jgi:gamma-glutamyl hercynylcysteine S-oxide synthase